MNIRQFFLNNLGLKAISLLLAFLIWFQVSGQLAVQRTLSLPIEFVNMPSDLEISNDYARTVDVFVRFERTRRTLEEGTMALVVNLRGVTPGLETIPLTEQNIRNRPSGMAVLSIMPPTLRLELERTLRTIVKVTPNLVGEPEEGYQITRVQVSPSEVMIAGPESRVQGVSSVRSEPVNIDGLSSTLTRNVYLDVQDPRLRIENVASVTVTVRVEEERRQVRLRGVPVEIAPANAGASLITKTVEIVGSVPVSSPENLDSGNFLAIVNVGALKAGAETQDVTPEIRVPEQYREIFRVQSVIPEQVKVRKSQ